MTHAGRQATVNAALAASLASVVLWVAPPRVDFAATRLPARRLRPARLRALDELLVRRPLHLRRVQPAVLPARGARRDQAARRPERRNLDSCVHADRARYVGRADGVVDAPVCDRHRGVGADCVLPVRARARALAPRATARAFAWPARVVCGFRRADTRREPARVSVPVRDPLRDWHVAARTRDHEACDRRRGCMRLSRSVLAAFPRSGAAPLPRSRADRRACVLRRRIRLDLPGRGCAHPARPVRRVCSRLPDRLCRAVRRRRERRAGFASPQSRSPCWRSRYAVGAHGRWL